MIDEKRLVNEIKNWIKTDRFEDYSAGYILSDVIEEINKMPKAGEWIPVSERLPEPDTYVLVTYKNFDDFAIGADRYDQNIHDWFCFEESVIAWQPFPEPYREESVENEHDGNPLRVL